MLICVADDLEENARATCNQLKFYNLDIMDYQIINENEVSRNNECLFASILVYFY